MKAVIMAGGRGTRLRPLTERCPKPMARLCGRPVVEYILELLAKNGVTESVLTLQYLPDQIVSHFPDNSFAGVALSFCEEAQPLGTAGSVKNAAGQIGEDLLVISGDALCDFSLREAMDQHAARCADVTIVTARVGDPREYGLVIADSDGHVTGFIEKPSFAQATSELANTGIYILSPRAVEMIPDGQIFDFAADLFPRMLEKGMAVDCCTLSGYWCDIGDLEAYRRAQADLLAGRVDATLRGQRDESGSVFAARRPSGRYEIEAPVYIGEGVSIGDNAVIGAGTVLDDGCTVAAGAAAKGSILLPHSLLSERAAAVNAIVCTGAALKSRAALLDGAAVGEDAVVGAGTVVREGVRIAGGVRIQDGTAVSGHITERGGAACTFDDEGLCGEIGVELTPELAARVGCAVGTVAKGRPVGVAAARSRSARALCDALIAGVRSTGASVLDFGCVFEAMFGFAMGYNALTLGVYISAGESGAIRVLCDTGLPAPRRVEREIELMLARGEFARAPRDGFGDRVDMSGIGVMYMTELLRLAPEGLEGMRAHASCPDESVGRLLSDALQKLGCERAPSGIRLMLSTDGRRLSLFDGNVRIGWRRAVAAYCLSQFEQDRDVAVENDFPRALDAFAEQRGHRVYRYLLCPADGSDAEGRRLAAQQQSARDGLMLAIQLLGYMKRHGFGLEELDRQLPGFAVEESAVKLDRPPARLLERFSQERAGEGVVVRGDRGVVLLRPRKNGREIRVFAEAANWETARELSADIARELTDLLDKDGKKE